MSKRKKVFNEQESKKASQAKGSVRSSVKLAAITTCQAVTHVDRKKFNKAGGSRSANKTQLKSYAY
jgi:hypothetical protein